LFMTTDVMLIYSPLSCTHSLIIVYVMPH